MLEVVEKVHEYIVSLNQTEGKSYLSSDATFKSDFNIDLLGDLHTPKFLNDIRYFGMPNHELRLKVGTPVMLLPRYIDHSIRLCNGTRLVITKLGYHVLEAKVIIGTFSLFLCQSTHKHTLYTLITSDELIIILEGDRCCKFRADGNGLVDAVDALKLQYPVKGER
ncbi:PIF1 helicase [Abeliophyllum distichum]|uniref:PIF1 helicase n=1 Tax=Abeliophyllum distichum TaxID=126358 RepID=A0ABD1REI3_9LAMI